MCYRITKWVVIETAHFVAPPFEERVAILIGGNRGYPHVQPMRLTQTEGGGIGYSHRHK